MQGSGQLKLRVHNTIQRCNPVFIGGKEWSLRIGTRASLIGECVHELRIVCGRLEFAEKAKEWKDWGVFGKLTQRVVGSRMSCSGGHD